MTSLVTFKAEEIALGNYESKLQYILDQEKNLIDQMIENDKMDYILNHFIMSDFDAKQLRLFIFKNGEPAFFELLSSV